MKAMGERCVHYPELREGMRIDVGDVDGALFVGILTRYEVDETTGAITMTIE